MEFDEKLNGVKLGMEERKNFYLIYKEALNNIVKYAGCKQVWIEMKLNDSHINLEVRDDGNGFDAEKRSSWQRVEKHKAACGNAERKFICLLAVGKGNVG